MFNETVYKIIAIIEKIERHEWVQLVEASLSRGE